MDGEREFENCFPDYVHDVDLVEYDKDSNLINETWRTKLTQYVHDQLKRIENHLQIDTSHDISVYTGSTGICYLYLLLGDIMDDEKDYYQNVALNIIEQNLKSLSHRRISFLCGDAGPLAVGAFIYHQMQKIDKRDKLIQKLLKMHEDILDLKSELPDEILYGRAGYLFSLLFLRQFINDDGLSLQRCIRQIIEAILESGKALSKKEKWKCPLMYKWHEKHYFGAAHGISGILFMLLQASDMLKQEEKDLFIKPTIDYLITFKFSSGNYPSSYGNRSDKLYHWCHGAPGFVHLYILAYKVFGDDTYLKEALSCGDTIWKKGLLKKGYGMCHGVAGNAFSFLQLFRLTGERKHLYRATKFAYWCIESEKRKCRTPDRPMSLFEGLSGTVWFLVSMLNPKSSKFPAFQLW